MKVRPEIWGLALLSSLVLFAGAPASSADWNKALFNPEPNDDDLLLPLPCNGQLALRKVVTNNPTGQQQAAFTDLLADRELTMGRVTDGARGYIDGRREEHIAGPISQVNGERFYYIGKYEVSVAQYDAVMAPDGQCPRPTPAGAVPKADISWYDAVDFTRKINRWLYAAENGITSIAALGIPDGYVRLPTETEWEFAARGGLAVGDAVRADTRFPMPEGLDAYAWFNASQSAGNNARPIGTRKPNPLSIYDIYGNLSEMTLDPFRMTRADRLHGLIGGFTVRGGSFMDDPVKLNSALREEQPFFSHVLHGEFHTRTIGFRVVVGTSALSNSIDPALLEQAANALQQQDPNTVAPGATERLAELAAVTENRTLRSALDEVRAELTNEFTRRNDLEGKQMRGSIINAALVARELSLSARGLNAFWGQINGPEATAESIARFQPLFDRNYESFRMFRRVYVDGISALAGMAADRVTTEMHHVEADLSSSDRNQLVPFAQLVERQVSNYADGRVTETRQMVGEIVGANQPWDRGD